MAEYISVDQDLVYSLPPSITREPFVIWRGLIQTTNIKSVVELGALMEPLAVAWHAVKKSNIKVGDKVLVLGGGPVCTFSPCRVLTLTTS